MARRAPFHSLLLVCWAALSLTSGNCQTSNLAPERITTRPGLAVVRQKAFFSDELVKCLSFRRIEDRTAADNPNHGYLVFMTTGGEVRLPPQTVEELFFFDEFEFPKLMTPPDDLNRLAALKDRIERVSEYNDAIKRIFEPHASKVFEAVRRLKNDEWWEAEVRQSSGGWITKREREIRTAHAEKKALELAASEVQRSIESIRNIDALDDVDKSVEVLRDLPATTSEVSAIKKSLTKDLREAASERRSYLEGAQLNVEAATLRSMIDQASTTDDVDNVFTRMRAFEVLTASSPEVAKQKSQLILEISVLRDLKDRRIQLRTPMFETFAEWLHVINQARNDANSDADMANLVEINESGYRSALSIRDQIQQILTDFKMFLSKVPSDAFSAGRGLPPLPHLHPSHVASFDAFFEAIEAAGPARIGELDAAAEYLKKVLHLYQELIAVSKRPQRLDLWRSLNTFEDLLTSMPSIRSSILAEKSEFESVAQMALAHENAREFAEAAGAYQKAHDIAPSPDLREKVQSMKNQDLGL